MSDFPMMAQDPNPLASPVQGSFYAGFLGVPLSVAQYNGYTSGASDTLPRAVLAGAVLGLLAGYLLSGYIVNKHVL
jgi:hypothetical protein